MTKIMQKQLKSKLYCIFIQSKNHYKNHSKMYMPYKMLIITTAPINKDFWHIILS
jgi:hypothetical protein